MRTAFFYVGTVLATMANLPSAMELDSNTNTNLDTEVPADTTLATDLAAEWQVHQLGWGNKCRGLQDQECSKHKDCSVCRYSWPKNDGRKWKSPQAACRCKANKDTFKKHDLHWGNKCKRSTDQDCGKVKNCSVCRWSWPKWDGAKWKSQDALCRCKHYILEFKPHQLGWGNRCNKSTDQDCGSSPNCSICRWSWPKHDGGKWKSQDARCRCKNVVGHYKNNQLDWGNKCNRHTD